VTVIGLVALAGCGTNKPGSTAGQAQPPRAASAAPVAATALEQAARTAIYENHTLYVQALWTDSVPTSPTATAGPALAVLRQSVAQRRAQKIRVRTLSERFRIVGLQLDPSYSIATAMVRDDQTVQPSYPSGRPRGNFVTLREHVSLELHRIGGSVRFVVWKVVLLP
jgi:hypothetical protein